MRSAPTRLWASAPTTQPMAGIRPAMVPVIKQASARSELLASQATAPTASAAGVRTSKQGSSHVRATSSKQRARGWLGR